MIDLVFSAKTSGSEEWKAVISAISTLVEEATFEATVEGISFRGMDPSHVALIDISWPNTAFERYECDGDIKFGVRIDEFSKNNLQMLTPNQLSSLDNFWLICYVDVCIYGDCYRDLPGEGSSSCPSFKSEIDKDFKVKKIIKKNNPHHKIIAKHYVK